MDDNKKDLGIGTGKVIFEGKEIPPTTPFNEKVLVIGDGSSIAGGLSNIMHEKVLLHLEDMNEKTRGIFLVPADMIRMHPIPTCGIEKFILDVISLKEHDLKEAMIRLANTGVSARRAGKSLRTAMIRLANINSFEDDPLDDLSYGKQQAIRWANTYSKKHKKKSITIRPSKSQQRIMFSRNSLSSEHYAVTKERPANIIH